MKSLRSNGHALDLQTLHACGADCGGKQADLWLAYRRPGGRAARIPLEQVVRELHRRLGRLVTLADLDAELRLGLDIEHVPTEAIERQRALERRRIAATPPTMPHGPPPLPATQPAVPQAGVLTYEDEVRAMRRDRDRIVRPYRRRTAAEREQQLQAQVQGWRARCRALQRLAAHWEQRA
jgi:hypothetical protein